MTQYTLNKQNLLQLSERVSIPAYDRALVKAGIVHVGVGGFHRAHQAYYTDQLLHHKEIKEWGICGVALLESDDKIYNTLKAQNGLYTLIVKEFDGSLTKSVIGSIVEYLFAPKNPLKVIEKMANPEIKIITLTITEGGYNYNEATNEFDFNNPLIQYDLENGQTPKTIFGYLTQALKLRKENGTSGCAIQSCDNIQENGHHTKKMLLSYVQKAEPTLVPWIESHVSFPNSMVDRITPVTAESDILNLKETSAIDDAWPVVCEPFIQWIIEDDFIAGRPAWERVGAQFVEDVLPYETMKLRLLNAGHSVLGILGALAGLNTIDEAVNNSVIGTFLRNYLDDEVTPTLGNLKGVDLTKYKQSLIERFGNLYMKDQIDRICSYSSAKIPIFILPTINAQLKQNGSIQLAAFVIAAWSIYNLGKDEKGNPLNIIDAEETILHEKAVASKENPIAFLDIPSIFGKLKEADEFVTAYKTAYENITKHGVEKSVLNMNVNSLNK